MARGKLASRVDFGAFGATLGSCAGVTGVPAVHFRWSVFRRRRGMSAGGAGVPGLPRPVVGVSLAAGDKPQPYIRSAALPPAVHIGRWLLFRWRLGMSAGGAGFRASHVRWSVFRRRRGTSPSPTLGRRSLFRRRCRVPVLPRPVVGVSPAAGDKPQPYIRSAVIVSPAVQGSGPPTSGGRCFAGGGGQAPALH